MPRGTARREERGRTQTSEGTYGENPARQEGSEVTLSRDAIVALGPWLDVAEVGGEGLSAWLLSILPLIPAPGPARGRSRTVASAADRVAELARSLADCASDRARAHFQAASYFEDNRVLSRRVKALESMLRTRDLARNGRPALAEDPDTERAGRRYLPGGGGK